MRNSAIACTFFIAVAARAADPIAVSVELSSTVSSVFDELVHVAGDDRPPPVVHVVTAAAGTPRIAWFDPAPGKRAIYIEDKTVQICVAGPLAARQRDCLAFILGHELAHFYKDHAHLWEFAKATAQSEGKDALTEQEHRMIEAQADENGVYYSFLAGYDGFGVSPLVLDALYAATNLPSDIPGYPSLLARKQGLETARSRLARVLPVFDAGVMLFLTREFLLAARCFDEAGRELPSRELLNNAGSMRLLEALRSRGEKEPFAYPVEVDFESRLSQTSGRAPAADEVSALATAALQDFDRSIRQDPHYLLPLVNRSLALSLLERWTEALGAADSAWKAATDAGDKGTAARAAIAHGIAAHYSGNNAIARRDFESARSDAPQAARENLIALGVEKRALVPACENSRTKRERIAGLLPEDLRAAVNPESAIEIEEIAGSYGPLRVFSKTTADYAGYVIESEDHAISALVAKADYPGVSEQGSHIGVTYSEVLARYSCHSIEGSYGPSKYLFFPLQGAVFDFTNAGKLKRWMLLSVEPL